MSGKRGASRVFRPLFCLLASLALAGPVAATGAEVGTWYFPGWHRDPFMGDRDTWAPIRAYPERQPEKGWYDDTDPAVLRRQADEMMSAGLDFVVFDWYFEHGKVQAGAPFEAWLRLSGPVPKASLLWCRHGSSPPTTQAEWTRIVASWVAFARSPNAYRIAGRTAIFVFDTGRMAREAQIAGSDLAGWVAQAQAAMAQNGLPPIHFVAGVWNADDPAVEQAAKAGFAAFTTYNFRRAPGDARDAHGYLERDAVYRRVWQRMAVHRSGLPVILPLTAGWDKRPWGGSQDPLADDAIPTDTQFRAHLDAARDIMIQRRIERAIVCCWNEYGEGSIIEPTREHGDSRLRAIRQRLKRGGRD